MDPARRFGALFAAHDPGLGALRRAVRAAIIMPGSFALCLKVIDNPAMAAFAAFGAIATLVLIDFRGTIADRVRSQISLVVGCMILVCLGTVCSRSTVAAVLVMAVLGTVIVFSAVVSSVFAGATTALLLAFILPVSLPGPVSEIPDRVAGWGLSGAISVLAISLLWPAPVADPLRAVVLRAARALLACLRAPDDGRLRDDARESLTALSRTFLATPYRPTGLTTSARAGVRLVDEFQWLGGIILGGAEPASEPASARADAAAASDSVLDATADVLAEVVAILDHSVAGADALAQAQDALLRASRTLPERVSLPHTERVAACHTRPDKAEVVDAEVAAFASALDPAFRAQEASFMVSQIAANVRVIVAADARSWWERLLGRQPPGIGGPISSLRERAGAHLGIGSVAARNALRAGVALAIAVLASRLLDVEHAFWVSFGTLSILRSNALSTGQTFVRALGGTVLGFLLGAVLVLAIGTNATLLWALLPLVVLVAGVAPAAISFLAGQTAFTVVLFILFNILAPAGWRIGLVRLEDVALGGATSLVVGLLFWPRGAAAEFARALADAYAESTHYLTTAISQAVTCCAPGMVSHPAAPTPPEAAAAAAASRRLDDTYRTFLAEQGPKRLGLAGTAMLATGPSVLRLAGDAVIALWSDAEEPSASRFMAARELLERARDVEQWYGSFGAGLVGLAAAGGGGGETLAAEASRLPEPRAADPAAARRLLTTIDDDLRSPDGSATVTAVRITWTGAFLDAARRLEAVLVRTVREAGERGTLGPGTDTAATARARLSAHGRRWRGATAAGRD
ncbi:MAG TPA: FUSC family protein [Solirubrobacteraceae bacterium]